MKRRTLPEWLKTLLIVLLSLSAICLITLSPLYQSSPLKGWTGRVFLKNETIAPVAVSLTAATRPTRIAVTGADGRYGVQYDTSAVDAVFDQVSYLLGDALDSAQDPVSISERRWRRVLTEHSLYFDFGGQVPFDALAGWLRDGQTNTTTLTANVRRLALGRGDVGDALWLYYQDADTGAFFSSATTVSVKSGLEPEVSAFTPNGASFAFEDADYALCAPYTMLLSSTPAPVVYSAAVPVLPDNTAAVNALLSALSFSPQSVSVYTGSDGTVYKEGDDTLRLSQDGGTLFYLGSTGQRYPIASEGAVPTAAEYIEVTRQLVQITLGQYCGAARINLISALQEGDRYLVTYGYSLGGAPVQLFDQGWAAQFVITGGALTEFSLHPRSYTATAESTLLLPTLQAVAAMSALGRPHHELLLSYRDTGTASVSAGWIAN